MKFISKKHWVWVRSSEVVMIVPTMDKDGLPVVGSADVVLKGGLSLTADQSHTELIKEIENE